MQLHRLGWLAPVAVGVLAAIGCGSHSGEPKPGSPVDPTLPADLNAELPHTPEGLPVLTKTTAGLPPGLTMELVYDAKSDDVISRYGKCLGVLGACYDANHGRLGDCFDAHPEHKCATNAGGTGCCAKACVELYQKLLTDYGNDEDRAVDDSFLQGDCLDDYTAARTPPGPPT